ncbi:MAG: maleylpyruvate isomerase family mycothiol-dependent enzyme [Actinomycetia bacterium]|nr:maleylpyruvate isomerase family mycothiol-dependent enzyme [Actinomycetes bacterium]
MDSPTLLEHLATEGARVTAIGTDRLSSEVPSMPGWDLGRLIGHLGVVSHLAAADAAGAGAETDRSNLPKAPRDESVVDYYAASLAHATEVLGGLDPEAVCSTWNGPQTVGWWIRRLTHETAMHRWDAENTLGEPVPIDAALAVDAIDEIFDLFTGTRFDLDAFGPAGETIHLHATDIDGEWLAAFTTDGVTCERAHARGDVAVRGPASDLLLAFWSRRALDGLEVFGDASLIPRWQAAASF